MPDLHFYFDPNCPFAWMTSKWVRQVNLDRPLEVEWRFISLRVINDQVDYATHFPSGYERSHSAGLELLRVAAAARRRHGPAIVGPLYEAMGTAIFEGSSHAQRELLADSSSFIAPVLKAIGLDIRLADDAANTDFDAEIRAESDEALKLTGRDVGTPILHFDPPEGTALFGPVISRLPSPQDALSLWDHVVGLSRFAGFAELKRSLRETVQLPALGMAKGQVGVEEDWQQGHRRLDTP